MNKIGRKSLDQDLINKLEGIVSLEQDCEHDFVNVGLVKPVVGQLGHYIYRCRKCNKKKYEMET